MKIRWQKNWRNKPYPYWFARRYPSGGWTVQVMALNIWGK